TVKQGTSTKATYRYNAFGQRVSKVAGSTTTYYVYDDSGLLLGEYNSTGAAVQEFVWLDGLPAMILTSTANYYVHPDHLGTPRLVYNAAGTVIWRWNSDPFGATPANEDPDGNGVKFTFNLRFPGQYFDKESNLHYNYFRDYDPSIGRYVQGDPIGLKGGMNVYGYVGGNPLSFVDPYGLEKLILLPSADINYPAALAAPDPSGQLAIFAHGNPSKVDGKDANQLADLVRKSGKWKPQMPIKLDACRTAEGDKNIAKDLSKLLDTDVTAPDARTLTIGDRDLGVWHSINIPGTDRTIPLWPGNWVTYSGGK
ncbi:MAG: RHS domain-containing protein, partial [Sulfuricella sp.]|nr:RHS domain-containing protein [Sulfuricella sp.]